MYKYIGLLQSLKTSNEMYKINYFMKFNETEAPIYNTVIKL